MDRRVVKTRQLLRDSLLSLLREKPLESIEIQEITEQANTARVTFYRHYGTKDELFLDILDSFYADLRQIVEADNEWELPGFDARPPELPLYLFLERDRVLYKRLFSGSASAVIQRQMRTYIVEQVTIKLSKSHHYFDVPIALVGNHIATNMIGNIMWWLCEDLTYSGEEMARLSHQLACGGLEAILAGRLAIPASKPLKR